MLVTSVSSISLAPTCVYSYIPSLPFFLPVLTPEEDHFFWPIHCVITICTIITFTHKKNSNAYSRVSRSLREKNSLSVHYRDHVERTGSCRKNGTKVPNPGTVYVIGRGFVRVLAWNRNLCTLELAY